MINPFGSFWVWQFLNGTQSSNDFLWEKNTHAIFRLALGSEQKTHPSSDFHDWRRHGNKAALPAIWKYHQSCGLYMGYESYEPFINWDAPSKQILWDRCWLDDSEFCGVKKKAKRPETLSHGSYGSASLGNMFLPYDKLPKQNRDKSEHQIKTQVPLDLDL